MGWELIAIDDECELEVEIHGSGEPIVFLQTALTSDELRPLAEQPIVRDEYRTISYRRRGYGGSTPASGPGSLDRDAADCLSLLRLLGVGPTHVLGLSYSAAVGLQLAASSPSSVSTLTVIEPPPVNVRGTPQFHAAIDDMVATYRVAGADAALDAFMALLVGGDWRATSERRLPGSVAQMEGDASTFFGTDLPALLDWAFDEQAAVSVTCPTLYIHGTESGPLFSGVPAAIRSLLTGVDEVVVAGADHSIALTHPEQVAAALVRFLRRHPQSHQRFSRPRPLPNAGADA